MALDLFNVEISKPKVGKSGDRKALKTLLDYIDEAKSVLGYDTYQKTMEHLGMSRQQLTAVKKGSGLSDKNCLRLAKLLNVEPLALIALSKMLRAENREIREYWARLATEAEQKDRAKNDNRTRNHRFSINRDRSSDTTTKEK